MAQVPYSPVPDVGMQDISTPKVSVSGGAIEGASGENIGRAMGQLGKVLAHSGDELYQTAMKLQEQKNQAEANEADANYSLALGDLHVKFASREGKDAADNLMSYKDEVNALRVKIREGLSSDAVRRMYDRHALNSMVIAVRGGASHAASQLKQYSAHQAQSVIDLTKQQVYDNPNDPIDGPINKISEIVRSVGTQQGKPPEEIEKEVRKHEGEVYANRIDAMASEKPLEAQKMLAAAIAQKKLWGDQGTKLQEKIDRKLNEVTSRNHAITIANDPTITLDEAKKQAEQLAEDERPGDPVYRQTVVQRTLAEVRQNKAAKREDQQNAVETVNEAILNDKVKTVDHLLQMNPGLDKVIDKTPGSYKQDIQGKINRYQAALNKPRNDEEFGRVSALRLNDPVAFAEVDPTKLDISTQQMNQIAAWQKADRKKPHENAKVTQAQQWIREAKGAELRALGIFSREKGKNDEEYDKYTNALSVAIDLWYDNHKKLPDRNQVINEIAPTLINREMEKGIFGGFFGTQRIKTEALINEPVPKEWEAELRAEARRTLGRELEQFEVGREWLRKRLKDVEKAKKKAAEGNE